MNKNDIDHICLEDIEDEDLATKIEDLMKNKKIDISGLSFKLKIKKENCLSMIVSKTEDKEIYIEMPIEISDDDNVSHVLSIMLSNENISRYKKYIELLDRHHQTELEMRIAKMVMDRIETAMKYSGIENIEAKSW